MTIYQGWDNRVSWLSPTTNMNIRWLVTSGDLGHLTQPGQWQVYGGTGGDIGQWADITIHPHPDQWPGTNTRPLHHCSRYKQEQNSWQNAMDKIPWHGVGEGGSTVQLMYLNQNNLIPDLCLFLFSPVSMCPCSPLFTGVLCSQIVW